MRRIAAFTAGLLILGACEGGGGVVATPRSIPRDPPRLVANEFALQPFTDCSDVLSYLKSNALSQVTAWGLGGMPWPWMEGDFMMRAAAQEDTSAAPLAGVDYSTTNLQELGVDEPDIVKTDGHLLLAVAQGKLFVIDVTGSQPTLLGSLALTTGWGHQIFLSGDTALLMATEQGPMPLGFQESDVRGIAPWWGTPTTVVSEVDLSDPTDPTIVRTLRVDGTMLSSRMTGTTARIVISSFPTGLHFVVPEGGGLRDESKALAENRRIITESVLEDWMPYYVLEDNERGVTTEGVLLDCGRVAQPPEYSGLSTLAILTVSLEGGIRPADSFGLVADGSTVYGSTGSLYVATQRWVDWQALPASEVDTVAGTFSSVIHRFDISDPAFTTYRASGRVPGYLLGQWAMSEQDGFLRVASTTESPWTGFQPGRTQSLVTVLEEIDGRLEVAGQVAGLGIDERIYAVRFIGDTGFVVTFRQTDPLYTIDLSDPTRPEVVGELKIPGYSAYLHPIGDGLLLGVGQDADENGRVKGTQVTVFDVSDPESPRQLHKMTLANGYSEAEWDHHAFLYWPATGLTVLPVQTWSPDGSDYFAGALGLKAGAQGIEEIGRLEHDWAKQGWQAPIRRALVVGDSVLTFSELGILTSDLSGLGQQGWLQF